MEMTRHQRGSLRQEPRKDGKTWILRFRVTRADGKRVEHKIRVGLVRDLPKKADAWKAIEKQRLNVTINDNNPTAGRVLTFGALAANFVANELSKDQDDATIGRAHSTNVTYRRYLNRWILPRWETSAALGIEPLEVEQWLKSLRSEHQLENTTLDKIRNVMGVVFKHGQRYGLIPRDESANPMLFVRCKTTSYYIPVIVSPEQAFDILLNMKEPERTLSLTDAATGLRISEIVALTWDDVDFINSSIYVRRAYVYGQFGPPKSKASRAPVPMHPLLAAFLQTWHEQTPYAKPTDFVFPSFRLKGKKPRTACMLVRTHLRPAAVAAGVLEPGQKIRFGFHNFRHSLASQLAHMKVEPKVVQEMLRHSDLKTTFKFYVQAHDDDKLEAQGSYLKLLLGDKASLLQGELNGAKQQTAHIQ
jgi:integrase